MSGDSIAVGIPQEMVGRGISIVRDSLSHSLFIRLIVIHSFDPTLQLIQSLDLLQ